MYLPDTNIFILGLKGHDPEARFLAQVITKKELFISVVAMAEFLAKAEGEGQLGFLKLTESFKVLPIDQEVSKVAAQYRKISFKTKRAHLLDCFLAAQARLNGLILVTNDKSDFPMKDVKIITL